MGLVQQNKVGEDPDCVEEYCKLMAADPRFQDQKECPFKKQIKVVRVESKLAAGEYKPTL